MKIILDTNFLIYCAKNKLDYKEEIGNLINENYDLIVTSNVIQELEILKNKTKKGKDKDACDLALQLLHVNGVKVIDINAKNVDDSIIALSRENKKNIVCTLDKEMRNILGRVILISRGRKLILTR